MIKRNAIFNFAKNNKRNIVITFSVLIAIIVLGTIYAYFSDVVKVMPSIKSGIVSVKLVEDVPFDDLTNIPEIGAMTTTKTFRAVSDGNIGAYVRAKIIPVVEYYDVEDEEWITTNIPTSDIELGVITQEWIEEDGYYYYRYILLPGQTSEDVMVTIANVNVPDNLKAEQIRLTIKVILESAQVEYYEYENIFNIANLPDGVEEWIETKDGVPIPRGFGYVEGTRDTGVVIRNSADGNEFVWIPCTMDGAEGTVKYEKWTTIGIPSSSTIDDSLPDGVPDEIEQIKKYGGFYIARYEAGIPDTLPEAVATASLSTRDVRGMPISKKNSVPWNYITYGNAKANAQSMYVTDAVRSGLVTGTQWDTVMKWLSDSGYDVTNSTGWGNHVNALLTGITQYSTDGGNNWTIVENKEGISGINAILKTGNIEYTNTKNMYDIAGNLYEWTNEKTGSHYIERSGCFWQSGNSWPASSRYGDTNTYANYHIGFRCVLYMK